MKSPFKVVYINLDAAKSRRTDIEKNFSKLNSQDWVLERFQAINNFSEEVKKIKTNISNSEKACALSHINCIKKNLSSKDLVLVVEDDTEIGVETHNILINFLNFLKKDRIDWDILYTDLIIPDVHDMIRLVKYRHDLKQKKQLTLLDLTKINSFAGLSAYIINPSSSKKINDLIINNQKVFDTPIDIYVRELIHQKKIKGLSIFPFITTVSRNSINSQIQSQEHALTEYCWSLFRMLIWNESEISEQKELIKIIQTAHANDYYGQFGPIISHLISDKFITK